MATKSKFRRSRATIKEFDGVHNTMARPDGVVSEEASLTSSNTPEPLYPSELVTKEDSIKLIDDEATTMSPPHFLLVAMLDHLCSIYVSNPAERRQVFKVLHKELVRVKVLSPVGGVDELSSVRAQYKVGFAKLVKTAIDNVCCESNIPVVNYWDGREFPFVQPRDLVKAHKRLSLPELLGFQSRYQEEFIELGPLGRGAYGSVYKCQHKLDGRPYAVKKVAFQDIKPDLCMKVLREVKYLAGLNHKYVVRYHGAWLEYHSPTPKFETTNSRNLPAIAGNYEDSRSSRETSEQGVDDDSFEIVFDVEKNVSIKDSQLASMDELSEESSSGIHAQFSKSTVTTGSMSQIKTPLVLLHIQMQLCDRTLKDWLSNRNHGDEKFEDIYDVVDESQTQMILKQILKGLDYIHSQSLIHRDLKPKNIFLMNTASGAVHAKIGDFGLARHIDNSEPLTPHPGRTNPSYEEGLNMTSGVGTTIYASPEQLEGSDYTSTSDVYSFGLILFELYHPFHTEMERLSTINKVREGEIPELFCEKWPLQASYLKRLLDANPDFRPFAADILKSELFLSKDEATKRLQAKNYEQAAIISNQKQTIKELQMQMASLKLQLHQKDQLIAVKDRQLREKTSES